MKKFFVLFFILMFVSAAVGQNVNAPTGKEINTPTDKGSFVIGGTFNTMSLFGDFYANSTLVILNPFVNYFIKNNIMVGGMLQMAMMFQEDFSENAIYIGPSFGYALKKFKPGEEVTGSFIPYAKVGLLLALSSQKFQNWKLSNSGFSIPIGVGAMYMLTNALALIGDIHITLDRMKTKDNDRDMLAVDENGGALGAGRFEISVGLSFLPGMKK